ncbi:hypothetical protein Ccrd_020321 [Cynara cardunculus var. scolymus]|uniref:Uncharacterized protein n=1 Tax=Cynara cardunculus var. scolymus TaxID=59895 RepID=A0A118K0K5_CYNCS|nr:hypothetical protein Ccrd_020321 [Cynara cardunculus var. scolymus]
MENQDFRKNQPPFYVLKGQDCSKILSRNSSASLSSRTYYQNTTNEGVPFKWEMQPGTPKNPPRAEVIPPPTPPPAVQSLSLPRLKVVDGGSKDLLTWRSWSWKKLRKNFRFQRHDQKGRHARFTKHEIGTKVSYSDGDSDAEFTGWVCRDSRSSSSSSLSSLGSHTERFERGSPFLCSPWRT